MNDDQTAKNRLRDTALDSFARRGLSASMREIAADAGVTAGLITHHFGSKAALRKECDAEALRRVFELKSDGLHRSPVQQLAMIGELEEYRSTLAYLLRAVREGGPAGRAMLDHLVASALSMLEEGVDSGVLKPSRNPEARAKFLTYAQLGMILLQLGRLGDEALLAEDPGLLVELATESELPIFELYTEGLLMDRTLLDAYISAHPTQEDPQ